jgi:hypothetical protein
MEKKATEADPSDRLLRRRIDQLDGKRNQQSHPLTVDVETKQVIDRERTTLLTQIVSIQGA